MKLIFDSSNKNDFSVALFLFSYLLIKIFKLEEVTQSADPHQATDGEAPTTMPPQLLDATRRDLQSSANIIMTSTSVVQAETRFQTEAVVDPLHPLVASEEG